MEEQSANSNRNGADITNSTNNVAHNITDEQERLAIVIQDEASHGGSSSTDDIDEWLKSILDVVNEPRNSQSRKCLMEKVPEILRTNIKDNNKYFDPRVVSIGPYHHGKSEFEPMDKLKPKIMKEFVTGTGNSIKYVYNKVAEVAKNTRSYYVEGSTDVYSDQEFAQMMFLDGCFVSYMIDTLVHNIEDPFNLITAHQDTLSATILLPDIFLLENQLPFQVLQVLMRLKFREVILNEVFSKFINWMSNLCPERQIELERIIEEEHPLHLLELLRESLLVESGQNEKKNKRKRKEKKKKADGKFHPSDFLHSFRTATELKSKGIHFKSGSTSSLKDIYFNSNCFYGLLTLPYRVINIRAKFYFLNLIAYEICPNSPNDLAVTSYVNLMAMLIGNADDVRELRSKRILGILGSDQEVAQLFREINPYSLCSFLAYDDVKQGIQEHYDSIMKTWMAEVIHNYFSSPWTIIALFAAAFVIILACIQTYFTVFSPQGKK